MQLCNMVKLYYGFLDESGILEKKAKMGVYFIVCIIIVGNPVEIQNAMKIARHKSRGKFRIKGIFKASHANPGFVKAILTELSKRNIGIIIGVLDKRKKKQKIDKNTLYSKLLAKTIAIALGIYPRLDLVIHKRYTLPRIQNQIRQQIVSHIAKAGLFLAIAQRTETECRELELSDAIAWAVFQKYNNKKLEFYEIIKKRIVKENRLAA